MSNELTSSKKLLIVCPPAISQSDYLCLLALTESLTPETQVHVATNPEKISAHIKVLPPTAKFEIKQAIAARKFVLSFNKQQVNIQNIQWQQSEADISFYITVDKGLFSPQGMRFNTEGSDYDTIVFLNVGDFNQVQAVFQNFPTVLDEAKLIALHQGLQVAGKQLTPLRAESADSLAQSALLAINNLKEGVGNKLIASLLIETGRLKRIENSKATLQFMTRLVENGASLNAANDIVNQLYKPAEKPAAGGNKGEQPEKKVEEKKPTSNGK